MKNYYISDCMKNYDLVLILLSEEVDSPKNLKPEENKTFIRYQYGESAGTAPSYLQIRRNYQNAAKASNAKIQIYIAILIRRWLFRAHHQYTEPARLPIQTRP